MTPSDPGRPLCEWTLKAQVAALGLLLIAEFLLFQRLNAESAWIYPRWDDQVQYLTECYRGYEYRMDHGFWAGIWQTWVNLSAQGTLHDFFALLVFTVVGPSRAAALDVNMLAFLALQAATFVSIRRATRSDFAAWISVGFLAAILCPWSGEPGSATDFRLDWLAACTYGIALGAAALTDGFRSSKGALIFGFAVGVALLTRFLTAVYFGLIFAALLVWVVSGPDRSPRLRRLALSAGTAFGMAAPIFWINRHAIANYYWIGHVVGPERALRDSHMGIMASVQWIVSEVVISKVGIPALILVAATLAVLWVSGKRAEAPVDSVGAPPTFPRRFWIPALLFLAAPAAVLCIHPVKTPQTLGILIAPLVWLAVLGSAGLARRGKPRGLAWKGRVVCAAGLGIFAALVLRKPYPEGVAKDASQVNALLDYVYFRSEEAGLLNPRIASTHIMDVLSAKTFSVLGYERHHHWTEFFQTLPTGLVETKEPVALERLGGSDFVFLVSGGESLWPFDRQMQALLPVTRSWCDTHRVHLVDLVVQGRAVSVYERSGLTAPGKASAVDLKRMLAETEESGGPRPPAPPAAPILTSSRNILWSAGEDVHTWVRAAFSPVQFSASGLPPELTIDARTGEIRGVVQDAGSLVVRITVTNALGTTSDGICFTFEKGPFLRSLAVPPTGRVGIPLECSFACFRSAGTLDFIDITDLTMKAFVARLPVPDDSRFGWQGNFPVTFSAPGEHQLLARFVCYDARSKDPYSFEDEIRTVSVRP